MRSLLLLAFSFALCLGVGGAAGSWATRVSLRDWYPRIRKPWFTPPNLAFPIAWTTLFILMSIALFRVLQAGLDTPGVPAALAIFGVHLVLNILWSVLFFTLRRPDWALLEILPFWGSIVWTMSAFGAVDPAAAWLLAPYLVWVAFAGFLNWSIWRLNRGLVPGEGG